MHMTSILQILADKMPLTISQEVPSAWLAQSGARARRSYPFHCRGAARDLRTRSRTKFLYRYDGFRITAATLRKARNFHDVLTTIREQMQA
jgi:hypothetical protein